MISPTAHISFSIGTLLFVDKMFRELNLDGVIAPLKVKGIKLTVIVRAMIAYKLADNFSIKKCHEWMNQKDILEYYHIKPFTLKTLYRALETLGNSFGEIMKSIQEYLFSHYQFESTDEYLDWTSLVLWGEKANLGEYGYSRDHRPDKKQITIGLSELAKPIDIPIGMTIKAGNINDMEHFKSTFVQTSRYLKPGSLITFDKGANSDENLDLIEGCGHDYLTSMKFNKSLDKRFKRFWKDKPECINPEETDEMKRIYGVKVVYPHSVNYLYFSHERERLDKAAHHKLALKQIKEAREIEEKLRADKKLPAKYRTVKNKLLKFSCSIQTLLGDKTDEVLITELECKLCTGREGFFALKSSRNLTLKEAHAIYRSKDSIEKLFNSLKNEIEIKPLRVWTDSSIRGALLIGFISQLFVSLARYLTPEVKRVSTKFFLKSLENLTVTVIKSESAFKRLVYSNFNPLNMVILGIDNRNQWEKVGG